MDVKYIEFESRNGTVVVVFLGVYAHDAMCRIVQQAEPSAMPVSAGFASLSAASGTPSFVFYGKSISLHIKSNNALSVPLADVRGTIETSWSSPVLSNSDIVLKSFGQRISEPVSSKGEYGQVVKVQGRKIGEWCL